jgi:peptidoglycan/LPS O-acetylase OafA/YrhL
MQETHRIGAIDGLRAVAMLMVVAGHCMVMSNGWSGVWLFFIISGYVITRNFLARQHEFQTPSAHYLDFIKRRAFRIVPAYAVYLIIATVVMAAAGLTQQLRVIPYLLTFTYNWQRIFLFENIVTDGLYGPMWSLSVEEQFYVFYPLLFLVAPRRDFLKVALGFLCLAPFARIAMSATTAAQGWPTDRIIDSVYLNAILHFDAFLAGALIAVYEPRLRTDQRLVTRVRLGLIGAAIAYGFINYILRDSGNGETIEAQSGQSLKPHYWFWRQGFVYSAYVAAFSLLMIEALRRARWTKWLAARSLVLIGRISYSGYLYHIIPLWLLRTYVIHQDIGQLSLAWRYVVFAGAVVVTLALAWLSYAYVELPVQKWAARRRESKAAITGMHATTATTAVAERG